MRFAHSRAYVEAIAREAALRPLLIQSASTRREAGADAPGLICVFAKTASQRVGRAPPQDTRHELPMARSPLPLAGFRPRLWRPIGHPAMAGAIGLALRRREPAIGEIPASRIAERPPAGGFANLLEPHPPHLPDLGFAKGPRRPSLPGSTWRSRAGATRRAWLVGAGRSGSDRRPLRPSRALARALPAQRRARRRSSLIPIRLALPMTAFRDPTPSAAAMWLALFPSRASFLRSSTASAVHSICTLQWLSLRRSGRAEWFEERIFFSHADAETLRPSIARQFWKNFQFLQHLKKTN